MNHSPEKTGKNIKNERLKRGLTQTKLGKLLGISGKQISNYENEDMSKNTLPPLDILFKLCDLFECDLGYLIGEDGYSQKTKKLTIAASETGFTEESLQNIREVMGISSNLPDFTIESKRYQKIINKFVSSSRFIKLIMELKRLDDIYRQDRTFEEKYHKEMDAINSKINKMSPIKATFIKENYDNPSILDDVGTMENKLIQVSFSDDDINIIRRLNSLPVECCDHELQFERDVKCQRYIIQETMSFLLNDLYPIDNS